MIRLTVFLLLMNLAHGSGSSNNISERMSNFLTKLCPGSNICSGNVSFNTDNSESTLCCTDCSCAPDCGIAGRCCFANDNQTLHQRDDAISNRTEDVGRQCLYPVTGEVESTDFKNFRSYHMISSIVVKDAYKQSVACGNKKVAPWGSLFPVFSKQANAIYKNELCAQIDNITDGVLWDAILKCRMNEVENLQAYLERGLMPKDCRVQFRYPGDFKDLQHIICYRDMIDYCTTTVFRVPVSLNASKNEIIEACQGGLVSPYYGDPYSLYSNVFCQICSGSGFYVNPNCSKFQEEKGHTEPSSGGIFGLLDIEVINSLQDAQAKGTLNREISAVCPRNTEKESRDCRPVLCPSGQVKTTKGRCVFPMQKWYQRHIQVLLELNSEQEFDVAKTFNWGRGYFSKNITNLSMPSLSTLKAWEVRNALFKVKNATNETDSKCLLLYMSRFFYSDSPISIMENIRLLTTANWSLNNTNETLILKPSLLNMRYPYRGPFVGHFKENVSLTIQLSVYELFYNNVRQRVRNTEFLVTKRFLCEQIELRKGEYFLSEDRIVLYNKIANNYVFDGEFVVPNDFSEETVRICIEGSGFVKSNAASCAAIASVTLFVVFSSFKVLLASAG